MATTIKIKRGLKNNLPTLTVGELAYCTDTNELFIGTDTGNALVNQDIDTDEYIVSGTFDDTTGDLTLTRSDAGEITVNLDGRYLQSFTDTNDYVTSADFTDGTLTLTRTDAGEVTVDLDGRYLQSFTESDPTVPAHVKGITTTNISNWDTAYTWGDHAQEGYLTSFTETDPVFTAQKGQPNGVAELDGNGKVPQAQLPSYVDDVLEYADLSGFPTTGETGKIYVAIDSNKTYRWSGSAYVEISEGAVPNDGTLTVEGGSGLTGTGTFSADQSTPTTITLNHEDTSTQTSVDNSANKNYIKSLILDTYGHVTSISSDTVSSVTVSSTEPSGAEEGDLWFDDTELVLYIYYNDGTSLQWVEASGASVPPIATEQEAIDGTDNTVFMTPLRTAQAYAAGVIEDNATLNTNFWVGTQAQYDALTPDANTLYFITE